MREDIEAGATGTAWLFYAFIIFLILATLGGGWALFFNRHAMPYAEETRRLTYGQSMTYQQGSQRDFENLCLQYTQATYVGSKLMIADTIRRRLQDYVGPPLDSDVQACIARIGLR
jgi:hypothetical protein